MFVDNKYARWYHAFIEARRFRKHQKGMQRHHIMPKSLGGLDVPSNFVYLTPREHFHAHLVLTYITEGQARSKMAFALKRFGGRNAKWSYAIAAKRLSVAMSGEGNPFYGKKHTAESKLKFSGENHGMHGRSCTDVWVENYGQEVADQLKIDMLSKRSASLSGDKNPMFGKAHDEAWRTRQSACLSGDKHFNYGKPAFNKNMIWMNNGLATKMVREADVMAMLDQGWVRGRLPKKLNTAL